VAGLSDGNEDELRDLIPRLTCPSASGTWLSSYCECVLQGVYAWLRRHPWQADCALAVVLLSFSAHQWADDPWAAVLSVLLAATVVPRQRYPVAAFAVAMALGGAQVVVGLGGAGQHAALQPNLTDLAIAVLLYTLAAWVLGDSVAYRYRRSYYASLEDRAARLEAERDAQVRIAAAAERARELQERRARAVDGSAARLRRIERDLHDGAQVRLTALAMTLGEIKENLDAAAGGIKENLGGQDDDGRTRMLVSAAHRNAKGLCRSPLCPGSVPLPAPRSPLPARRRSWARP
jgi:Histidine kinase